MKSFILTDIADDPDWPLWGVADELVAWWSADHGVTLETGDVVSAWEDRINGYIVAQATQANQPAFAADAFNGRACLVGDSNDVLQGTGFADLPDGIEPSEIWVLFGTETLSQAGVLFADGIGADGRRSVEVQGDNDVVLDLPASAGNVTAIGGTLTAGNHFFRGYFTADDARAALDTPVLGAPVDPNTNTSGAISRMFALASGNRHFSGRIRHVMVTNATLSDQKAAQLAHWMAAQL